MYVYSSIERAAQHEAKRTEQKARGQLERQKLQNEKVHYSIYNIFYIWYGAYTSTNIFICKVNESTKLQAVNAI